MTQPKDERQENIVAVIVEDDLNKKESEERKAPARLFQRIRLFNRLGACREVVLKFIPFQTFF